MAMLGTGEGPTTQRHQGWACPPVGSHLTAGQGHFPKPAPAVGGRGYLATRTDSVLADRAAEHVG